MGTDAGSLVAAFSTPGRAKAAMAALERAGIAHRDVRLLDDRPDTTRRAASGEDERVMGWLGRRWVRGALVGAVVGAVGLVLAVVVVRDGSLYPIWIGAAVGGAAAGAFVGGFVWVGAGMPRNPRAWDTYRLAHRDEACIAVRLRRADAEPRVEDVLRSAGATSVEHV
jgi:hypothetical protein